MSSEKPKMSMINVIARMASVTMYTEKVYIDLQSPVSVLKHKVCETNNTLDNDNFIIIYCGNVLEDHVPLYKYDIFNGATVHLYKKVKSENVPSDKSIDCKSAGLVKIGAALRSFSLNLSYKCSLKKMSKNEFINKLIIEIPQLNEDPTAIVFIQNSDLLNKLNDKSVKDIAEKHPALVSAALQIYSTAKKQIVPNHPDFLDRSSGFNEEIEDIDFSFLGLDPNSQPMDRNLPSVITSEQLATAIGNITAQQPQPSTSGASTSTGNTGNMQLTMPPYSVEFQPSVSAVEYSHQLGIMREMGLLNESLNLQALQLGSGRLETAIELVMSGLDILQ